MRILFLTDGLFPFQIGGMQKHSAILIKLLAQRGIQLTVVHPGGENFSGDKLTEQFGVSENLKFIYVKYADSGSLPGHYVRANRNYSRHIFETVKNDLAGFDLIYAQGFTGHYFISQKLSGFHKIPVIVNLHGFEMFQFAANIKTRLAYLLLKKEAKYNLLNADYAYSFGGKLDGILEKTGIAKSRILQHSNGIEDNWISGKMTSHAVRTFLFIGRNERRKGVNELNGAINLISENKKNEFRFHFIGSINENDRLKNESVIYHGELRDPAKIISIIDQCDCLVIPSYAEGMPTVILEAMARGLAIIGTDVGAVNRMIKGNGILLDEPDSHKIADSLKKIIEMSEADLQVLKHKSLDLVKGNFLWSKVVEDKIKDFCQITGKEV